MNILTKEKEQVKEVRKPGFISRPERTVEWLGGVNYDNKRQTLKSIREMLKESKSEEIHLVVNSYGGATAIGMGFYDTVRSVIKPNLVTIGCGEVDSSGVIVFLAGKKRFVTKNTTLLLHLGGRAFSRSVRFSTAEMENMLRENRLKDYQYACLVADSTNGRCTPEKILELMSKDTILTAEEAVNLGIAHKMLK